MCNIFIYVLNFKEKLRIAFKKRHFKDFNFIGPQERPKTGGKYIYAL